MTCHWCCNRWSFSNRGVEGAAPDDALATVDVEGAAPDETLAALGVEEGGDGKEEEAEGADEGRIEGAGGGGG